MALAKLNYNSNGNLVTDEIITLTGSNKIYTFIHNNVMESKGISVWTGTLSTGTHITDFTISKDSSKSWVYKITFGASVATGTYYVTYYSEGDVNDADDINSLNSRIDSLNTTVSGLTTSPITKTNVTPSQTAYGTSDILKTTINGEEIIFHGSPNFERKKIVIIGSSTASGNLASTYANSWAGLFSTAMQAKGYTITNVAQPADDTIDVLGRFYTDVIAKHPDFCIISLTLWNEGANDTNFGQYERNLLRMIKICRQHNIIPMIASNFPTNNYGLAEYRLVKQINRRFDQLGVVQFDFLGAVDNYDGKYLAGLSSDGIHVGDNGHRTFFKSIPLSIFDNLIDWNDKIQPTKSGSVLMGTSTIANPITGVFTDSIESFTVSFKFRQTDSTSSYSLAGFGDGDSRIANNGFLTYIALDGTILSSTIKPHIDMLWHDVTVSHNVLLNETKFYIDGNFVNKATETITLSQLIIGGKVGGTDNAKNIELKDVLVYRTRLNDEQIRDISSGDYPKSSLDLFVPLSDETFETGERLLNLAPTSSYLKVNQSVFTPKKTNVMISDLITSEVQFEGGGKLYIDNGSLVYMDVNGTKITLTNATPPPADTTPPVVSISPNGGTFAGSRSVTLSSNETADIFYTLDGTTPTTASTKYTAPISISATTTVKYFGRDTSSNSSSVQTVTFTLDNTAPNEVTNLATSNVTANSLTLTWTASASSDIASYDIYNGSTKLGNVTGATYNVSSLTASTQYTFKVVSIDTLGNQSTGATVTVTTSNVADTTAPNNVTNLTTSNVTPTTLTLSWTASISSDVASYDIYNGANFITNVTGATYNVSGLTASTQYTFSVRAKDGSNNVASGTTVTVTTSAPADTTPPNNVTNLTSSNVTGTTLTLSWTASTSNDIASYDVYNGANLLGNTTSTTYNISGLTSSTQYTFNVVSKDTSNNASTGTTLTVTTADTTAPIITASPNGGTFTSAQTVTLSSNETTTIYYTLDGSTPTTSSSVYSSPLTISSTTTLKYFGRDTAGNSSSTGTVTFTINAPVTPRLITDTFDTDGALTTTTSGDTWTAGSGVAPWSISGGKAYSPTATSSSSFVIVDLLTTFPSVHIQADVTMGGGTNLYGGFVFDYIDGSNMLMVRGDGGTVFKLYKKDNASWIQLGSDLPFTFTDGQVITLRVSMVGTAITVYANGTSIGGYTLTDAENTKYNVSTKHGLFVKSGTTYFDNFKIEGNNQSTFSSEVVQTYYVARRSYSNLSTSASSSWKGNKLIVHNPVTITEVAVSNSGTPTQWQLWTLDATEKFVSKVTEGTFGTPDGESFLPSTFATPYTFIDEGIYCFVVNYTTTGAKYTATGSSQTPTVTADFEPIINIYTQSSPPVAGNSLTPSSYAYDLRFKFHS